MICPSCGEDNPDRFQFCGVCGAPLATAAPAGGEERKVVSVLFCDLVGFTARSDTADPEDVRATLRPYHRMLKREIERFGGNVEKFIGDAVMAVFGAPVAHEDDAERAVRAALRITEAIPELNTEHPGLDLSVRAAVNTGEAVVSLGARPERGEGIVAGDVVNTASRLQQVAPVGGVVVGEVTYRATRSAIEYRPLDPVTVKGKAEAIPIWAAAWARSRFGVDVDQRSPVPLIGRTRELALLGDIYGRVVEEGGVQLVTISGEPGVGKTRLVSEFLSFVDDRPELVFWRQGRCLPYGDGVTFWALGEVVKAQAGILESDDPSEAQAKLAQAVEAVVEDESEREWISARLAPLAGTGSGGTSGVEREEAFAAWRAFLEAVAATRPLVMAVEDLHWADPAMLEFLEYLVDWSTGVPLLVLCTARPELYERHPGWGGGKRNSATVGLSPLSGDETARLVAALLDQAVLPADIQATLLDRAGGNPLYAEEFVRMLIDRGLLVRRGSTWHVAADRDIPVPETVQAIIAARLDTLTPDRKSLLQDGSVVGKVFWSGVVSAIGGVDEAAVREGLHELARKELLRPARRSSMEEQAEYSFWHVLIREVAYGQIPRAERARKHEAAARWIEEISGDRVADHADFLAHHYSQALDLASASRADREVERLQDPARRFLVMAGDRAVHLDPRTAEAFYQRAFAVTPREHPDWPTVFAKLADASWGTDSRPNLEIEDMYRQVVEAFRARGENVRAAEAMLSMSLPLWVRGETDRSLELAGEAVALLEPEPPGPELVGAYARLGSRTLFRGDAREGLRWSEKAVSLARELDIAHAVANTLQARGLARCELGDPGGIDDLRDALQMALDLGLGVTTSNAHVNLGYWVWMSEGPASGIELHRAAIRFAERRGAPGYVNWATAESCWMLYDLGEWDQLLAIAAAAREGDADRTWQAALMALTYQALVWLRRGQVAEAASVEEEILSRARKVGDSQVLVPALGTAMLIEHSRGDEAATTAMVEELHDSTRRRTPAYQTLFLPDAVRVSLALGATELAASLLPGIEASFARQRHSVLTATALCTEAADDPVSALALFDRAAEGWAEYGFVLENGQALLGAGRCLLPLGRPAEARVRLEAARAVFARLGARPLLEEIDDLLARLTALSS
ncbi:MAG: AAA family ATPase [Actinomycetota bacterium]|nr:AAA family ATPase [Actinomycetota bacterium]